MSMVCHGPSDWICRPRVSNWKSVTRCRPPPPGVVQPAGALTRVVSTLALPPVDDDELREDEELEPDRPSSGYSIFADRKYRQGAVPPPAAPEADPEDEDDLDEEALREDDELDDELPQQQAMNWYS